MVYSMRLEELDNWVKNKAKPGEVAVCYTHHDEHHYYYVYDGPDPNPFWRLWQDDIVEKYLEEVNKLKIEDTTVNKRCENCKYWNSTGGYSRCDHEDQAGTFVPKFTLCAKHEPKDTRTTPFDGIKFYLIDNKTGELGINYVCEDCGKIMDKPFHWWLVLPVTKNAVQNPTKVHGYHFRCEECDKEKEGKV